MDSQNQHDGFHAAAGVSYSLTVARSSPDEERLCNTAEAQELSYSFSFTDPHTRHWDTQAMASTTIPASSENMALELGHEYGVEDEISNTRRSFYSQQPSSISATFPFRSSSPWSPENRRNALEYNVQAANPVQRGYGSTNPTDGSSNLSLGQTPDPTQSSPGSSVNFSMQASTETIQGNPYANTGARESPYPYWLRPTVTEEPHFGTRNPPDDNLSLRVPQNSNDPSTGGSSQASSVGDPTSPATGDTPPVLACSTCGRQFTGEYRKGNRARHIRIQHGGGNNAPKIFGCMSNNCLRNFRRPDAMLKHVRKHHPEMNVRDAVPRPS